MAATTIKGIDINGATKQIDYEALANKPTIPTTVAELIDASNYVTSAYVESILSASTEIPTFYPLGDEGINMDDIYSQCDEVYGFGSANSGASASVLTFFNIWKDAPSVYRLYNSGISQFFQYGYGADIDVHIQNVYSEDETTIESHYFSLNGLTRAMGEDSFSGHPFEYKAIIISIINGELYTTVGVPRYINVYDYKAKSTFGYLPITYRALESLNVINISDFYKIITYCAKYFASYSANSLDQNNLMMISDEDYKFLYSLPSIFTIGTSNSYIPLFNVHDSVNSNSTQDVSHITTKYIFDNLDILSGYGLSNLYYYEIHSGSSTFWKLKVEAPFRSNSNIITATKNSDYSLLLNNNLEISQDKIPTFPIIKDKTYNEQPYIWKKNNKTYFSLNGISYEYYAYFNVFSAAPIQSSVAQPLLNYTFTLNTGGTFDAADSDIINDIVFKAINPSKSNLMIKVASGSSAYWFNSFGYDSGTGIISCDTYIPNLSSNLTLNIDSAGTGTLTMTQEKKHTQTIILNGGTVDLSCGDNVTYVASDLVSACTITCEQTPKTDGIENVVIFKTSAVTPSITISGGNCTMVWANNDVPSFKANKVYEVRATINDLGGTKYCMLAYAEYKAS